MEAIELRKAAQELRAIWVAGNEYLQAAAPWTAIKTDPDRAAAITRFSLNLIRLYAVLSAAPSSPTPPTPCSPRWASTPPTGPTDLAAALEALPAGQPFTVPPVLFAKLDDTRTAELAARFAGSRG